MSQFFTPGGQSIKTSASASVLPWAHLLTVSISDDLALVPDSKNLYHNEDQSRELRPRQKKKKNENSLIEFLEYFSLNIKIMFVICSRTPFP